MKSKLNLIQSFVAADMIATEPMSEGDLVLTGHLVGCCGNDAAVGETYKMHLHAIVELHVDSKDDFIYIGTPVHMPVPRYDGEDPVDQATHWLTTEPSGPRRGVTLSRGPVEDGGARVRVLLYPGS